MLNMMDIEVPIVGVIYGLLIVIFGSYVVMNLILAVIIDTFTVLQEEELSNKLSINDRLVVTVSVSDNEINLEEFKRLSLLQQEKELTLQNRRKLKDQKKILSLGIIPKRRQTDNFLDKLIENTQVKFGTSN